MNYRVGLLLALSVSLGGAIPATYAKEEMAPEATAPAEETMKQGDLAILLVHKLGLAPDVPTEFSSAIAISTLRQANILPRGEWQAEEDVTLGTLAYLLMQILEITPENPEDDASVVEACTAAGVDFSSIANALISAGILEADPLIVPTGSQFNDPLYRLPPGAPWDYLSRGRLTGDQPEPPAPPKPPVPPFRPPTPPPLTPN